MTCGKHLDKVAKGHPMVNGMRVGMLVAIAALAASAQNRPLTGAGRITNPSFAGNLAASVQGTLPSRPVRFPPFRPFILGGQRSNVLVLGGPSAYGYPSYVDPSLYAAPDPDAGNPPPVVVIQSDPPNPLLGPIARTPQADGRAADHELVKIYSNPVKMAPPDAPTKPPVGEQVVILALKDGGAETAIAYWTDGDQLKYVTPDRKQKQISLARVDTTLSAKLNSERGITFSLGRAQ
ncbi:MAG: hypothetical protein WA324_16620 [Bryobacteraceae bacterium]